MAGVYVIAHKFDDAWAAPCKIGISSTWPNRLSSLQSGNPKPIGLYTFVDIGDRDCARQVEKYLHHRFSSCRLTGEWFQVAPSVAACSAQFIVAVMMNVADPAGDFDAADLAFSISSGPGAEQPAAKARAQR